MIEGGTISITAECLEDRLKLTIQDTGPGIPDGIVTKLGTPFFTTKENGTGLGLATSMKIMEELKGSLEVSTEVNEGTSIILLIPTDESNFL